MAVRVLKESLYLQKEKLIITYNFKKNKKRNLDTSPVILMKLDAIGDFVMWQDSAQYYRKLYPNKKIILLCNAPCNTLAEKIEYFDEVFVISMSKFGGDKRYRKKILKEVSDLEASILIQTVYSRTFEMDLISSRIKASEKITIASDLTNISERKKKITDKIYDRHIEVSKGWAMELERNIEFISGLMGEKVEAHIPKLPKYDYTVSEELKKKYFVIFPGGSNKEKLWEDAKFAETSEWLMKLTGWNCCICGGENEQALAKEISAQVSKKQNIIDMTGKTTVPELVEVIRNAQLVISNDTSGVHIAAATDTPSVCIVGGWHFDRFLPYSVKENNGEHLPVSCYNKTDCFYCNHKQHSVICERTLQETGRYFCIENITVKQVTNSIKDIIDRKIR